MLDAAQARVVAYTTEDGEILRAEVAEERYGDEIRQRIETDKIREPGGWSFSVVDALAAIGLTPLSRYEVGEINSERDYDGAGPLTDDEGTEK